MDAEHKARDDARWSWQFGVAVGLIAAFMALVAVLMFLAGSQDIVWQRRVYLFGAVEAVVFTAVGWIFGREVHRSEATAARSDAARATSRAVQAERVAAEEQSRGKVVKAAVNSLQPEPSQHSSGPQDVGRQGPPQGPVVNLKSLLDELYR